MPSNRFVAPRQRQRQRQEGSATATLILCVVLVAAAIGIYLAASNDQSILGKGVQTEQKLLGLNNPVTNQLDPAFTDHNADLVADPPANTRDPDTLVIAYLSEAAGITADQLLPLANALKQATGKTVTVATFPDTDAALNALAKGELHVVGFNTGNVPRAVNVAGFVPVAAPSQASQPGQPARYRMALITPANSNIQSLADLAGKTVALTRPGSNSGFKAPLVLLRDQANLTPPQDYTLVFTYRHAASIAGIANQQYDVAATASDLLQAAIDAGDIEPGSVRVVYESEAFPAAALGHAHDLNPQLAKQIADALLAFTPQPDNPFANAQAMAPVNFKDDFALVRMIDDAAGDQHHLPEPKPQPQTETQTAQPL